MNGFLGTRGSFMLDLVTVGMAATIPLMFCSLWLVRSKRRFALHKQLQLGIAGLLLLVVVLFEIEMRMYGWTGRAESSRFWVEGGFNDLVDYSLLVHLCFAIPTPFIWATIIFRALRSFGRPPTPGDHSASHRRWGMLGFGFMTATAVTGWVFYYSAFAA